MKIKCKKCNSENVELMTSMIVSFPTKHFRNLTKKKMQSKDFRVWGVNWETSSFICKECGYTLNLKEQSNDRYATIDTTDHDAKIRADQTQKVIKEFIKFMDEKEYGLFISPDDGYTLYHDMEWIDDARFTKEFTQWIKEKSK